MGVDFKHLVLRKASLHQEAEAGAKASQLPQLSEMEKLLKLKR